MGLVVDTNVFVLAERFSTEIDFTAWREFGDAFMSVVSISELLLGVHRANTEERRARRQAFVEAIVASIPCLDLTADVARIHARLVAELPNKQTIGAHDALIGVTIVHHGFALLTNNVNVFQRLPRVQVLPLRVAGA